MYASMFNSLFNKSENIAMVSKKVMKSEITKQEVENMLSELDELYESEMIDDSCSMSNNNVVEAMDKLYITHIPLEDLHDDGSNDNVDDIKSEISSIGENKGKSAEVDDPNMKKIINRINSLQCLFTWNLKPSKKHNYISRIQNKYGDYNLDISSPEFSLERYIGNLIIGYELFQKGKTYEAQLKVLEIGKWLEELDKGTDEFYLSISSGLKHIMTATFIHMLFATNVIGEAKWLIDDIVPMASMNPKLRATVHAVRAAVLSEYGGNVQYLKKACECAKKSCELDPNTSHWFYIYSLALTTQRQFLQSLKSNPTENEKNAIRQAILLSNGQNAVFKYHEMILNRDTILNNFHCNKNKYDKSVVAKNLEDNREILKTIKSIMEMKPKDPLLVVKCARTLMTLPTMVRDFNLGKLYLMKAFNMAPNDVTILKAVENSIKTYIDVTNKTKTSLGKELGLVVKKHKNGENPIPYLKDLVAKFNGFDKIKIIAQICSYTILFTSDLKTGVEQFMKLIEQPGIVSNDLITNHFSSFGSKKFNLAELVFNEIRLATNSSSVSNKDMLFYFKILNTIMETCKFKVKDVDASMRTKLIVDSSAKSARLSTTFHSETDSTDNEIVVDKSESLKQKTKNCKPKHLQNTGPKIFINKLRMDKESKQKSDKNLSKNNDIPKNIQNKTINSKTSISNEQIKLNMSNILNSSSADGLRFSNNSNLLNTENLRTLPPQTDIENYTQQLYQQIVSNTQQHYNLHSVSSDGLNRYFNQNHSNLIPQSSLQNPHSPPLLSLRPQINQLNPKPKQQSKKLPSKKK